MWRKIWKKQQRQFQSAIDVPVPEISGRKIRLLCNINDEYEIGLAHKYHAEGVGLFRTEMPFIAKERLLTEEEQYQIFKNVLSSFPNQDVVIRLLDMGGDKTLSYYHDIKEKNPALGLRSIRFSLQNKAVFAKQIRAILRAGAGEGGES